MLINELNWIEFLLLPDGHDADILGTSREGGEQDEIHLVCEDDSVKTWELILNEQDFGSIQDNMMATSPAEPREDSLVENKKKVSLESDNYLFTRVALVGFFQMSWRP